MTKETDRELLEMAAKADGKKWQSYHMGRGLCLAPPKGGMVITQMWNPLRDDAQALRLAVKLGIKLELHPAWVYARAVITKYEYLQIEEGWANGFNDPCAATRRAIVRAAAEIGRAMP